MKYVYELLDSSYDVDYGEFHNIVIENINEFRKVVSNINNQEYIQIYDEDKLITNYIVISDIFNIDFNDKKIINKIFKDFEKLSQNDMNYEKTKEIDSKIRNYLLEIFEDTDYPVELKDDCNLSYLLKSYDLKIAEYYESFIEKLLDFIELNTTVFNTNILFTISITQYLSQEELDILSNFLKEKEILLINYDIINMNKKIKDYIVFDKDLCRIV